MIFLFISYNFGKESKNFSEYIKPIFSVTNKIGPFENLFRVSDRSYIFFKTVVSQTFPSGSSAAICTTPASLLLSLLWVLPK